MSSLDERPENLNVVWDPLKVHSGIKGLSNQPKLFGDKFKLAAEGAPLKCMICECTIMDRIHSRRMCKECTIMREKQPTFLELLRSMDKSKLDDMHKKKVKELMVYDPKRHSNVFTRFCGFHLANFDLDEKCEYL